MEKTHIMVEKLKPSWLFEDYLKTSNTKVIFLLILGLIYFLSAELGHILSIPPGNVTPLWPPSGIALAAVIMYGYRVWPGILVGAVIGTTTAIFDPSSLFTILKTSLIGTIIGVGVTLQGIVGGYLIKRFILIDQIFRKPINIIKFFSLSILSCIIGCTIGTTTLALFGLGEWERYLTIWITWIVGDSAGILIMTPFILVWFKRPLFKLTSNRLYESILLITLLLMTARVIATLHACLAYTFIPFLIWGAFRFGPHGATFTLLAISLISDIMTILDYGPFVHSTRNASLIGVQFYIAVVGLTGLIMSSLLEQLEEYSQHLEVKVREKTYDLEKTIHQLKDMQNKIIVQEKLSSLGLITAGIAHEIKNPLNFVNNFSSLSLDLLKDLTKSLRSCNHLSPEENESIHLLNENVNSILEQGKKADSIIQRLITLGTNIEREFKTIDIHQFLDESINLTYYAFKGLSSISVDIQKNYDKTIPQIKAVPEDITRVLINILNNAFYALEAKHNQLKDAYTPSLIVTTKNLGKSCEITIRDNGIGISKKETGNIFTPFFTTKSPGQGVGLGLSLSRDVIVSEHSGKLYFRSEEGSFTEFLIEMPE
jgi:signal transduction histidine kinase